MRLIDDRHRLVVFVGSGGVGKTTLAAATGLVSAREGTNTLVMTFDPSMRLKDALGVGEEARDREVAVPADTPGRLSASLLDARKTFDRLVVRYAPDEAAARRILENSFYRHLAGHLAGVLEYMAVERLFEVAQEGRHGRVVLDTPPTRQAIDFLEAPDRIVGFLESGALKIALKHWFDPDGNLKVASRLGPLGRGVEGLLDRLVGLELLRNMSEFFQAFGPLFEGFRQRAKDVQALLRSPETLFVLVADPAPERAADTMFFARKLVEAGYPLGPVVVNRIHPRVTVGAGEPGPDARAIDGASLLAWLGERDHRGLGALRSLFSPERPLVCVPLLPREPTDLETLERMVPGPCFEASAAGR